MPQLPLLSGHEIVKILERFGYHVVRQWGSHVRLEAQGRRPVTVPDYGEADRSLLRKILRDADISPDDFIERYQ